MTDISYASVIAPEKKVSKYAETKMRYFKNRMENDAEYKQMVYDVANRCHMNKRKNDPEYKAKYNEYQKNYMRQKREQEKLLKTALQQVAIC